ncbi:hypothetical protein GO011_14645 [Mycobacterium sp. 20091114027_K0903767]|nr:hypothetical protein [Mycobacterium sp. 20091114027_K0903767]
MTTNNPPRVVAITDTPDNIDYAKLHAGHEQARASGCSVILHNVCLECPSTTTVPPTATGLAHATIQHEDWCPVLAHHQGRQLTPTERRRHRRYMDSPR